MISPFSRDGRVCVTISFINQGGIYTGFVKKIDLGSKIFLRKTRPLLILKSTPIYFYFSKLFAEVGVFKHNVSKLGGGGWLGLNQNADNADTFCGVGWRVWDLNADVILFSLNSS